LTLLLVLSLALPQDSLVARLEPVRRALAQAETLEQVGQSDSALRLLKKAAREWADFMAGTDSSDLPQGWDDDTKLIADRFSGLESLGGELSRDIPILRELLYWLPRPKPELLKFTGYKCEKCVVMEQVLTKVSAEYSGRARIRTIDVNKDEAAARARRITVVPTMVFLDASGKEVSRVAREMTEAEVRARLNTLLNRDATHFRAP
jgi:thiol-disulfide isomerase/thioredoxin